MYKYPAEMLNSLASKHAREVYISVLGFPVEIVDDAKERGSASGRPCPICGGVNRFSIVDYAAGLVLCRNREGKHSLPGSQSRDGLHFIRAIMWARECSFGDACKILIAFFKDQHIL